MYGILDRHRKRVPPGEVDFILTHLPIDADIVLYFQTAYSSAISGYYLLQESINHPLAFYFPCKLNKPSAY